MVAVANAKNWRLREIASSCGVMGISLDDVAKDSDEGLGSIPRTRKSGIKLKSKLNKLFDNNVKSRKKPRFF